MDVRDLADGGSATSDVKLVNRLSESRSPYVRGHMHNPVAWQMWGSEAIELAKKTNRLLFVSIGYSACHWCHVMERESFENPEIANIINKHFIPVKVDREERPDVDRIYMNYVQATTGSGEVTAQLREFAQEGTISKNGEGTVGDGLDLELLEEAYSHFANKYDRQNAGFGKAPKFPTPANLSFLLRLAQYPDAVQHVVGDQECAQAKDMAVDTLRRMARGGIHDQIGNGFARLHDQPQLLTAYLDAYLITKDSELLAAAHDIATYLTSPPLQAADGGFFSSEDADSLYRPNDKEKREGAFYVWTRKEFQTILGERDAEVCAKYYNVRENGNVSPEHDAHDELINQNVLAIATTPEALAKEFGLSRDEVSRILESGRTKLLQHRNKERPRPSLDDKIVVSWNGLAVGALARFSAFLQETGSDKGSTYRASAEEAVKLIKTKLYDNNNGTMKRVYRNGPGEAPAFADDYAFLISGLIDLYEATFDDSHLEFADQLQRTQIKLFWDTASGGFFSTAEGQTDLILRLKDGMDNAEPSTNGVCASNLYRLGALLEDPDYTKRAKETVEAFEAEIMQHPFLFPSMLNSIVALRLGMKGIVASGQGENVEKAVSKARSRISTNTTIARLGAGTKSEWLSKRNALFKSIDVKTPRVQICEDGVCKEELDMKDMEKALREVR
ncbi:uncharacterized protein LTHEOB_6175 [Neofusicoccum parvum]|uniref:Uncharacterized protein LTHEOB_6175 n=1 Tax=Neofusicoccum parvum TaxID=310453 RepID=A0ACB5S646_9PEZI|nr:uncharacterized protein LTHEOB_6175 [Neofusicoccum parvum]